LEDEIVQLKGKLRGAYEEMEKVRGAQGNEKPKSAIIGLLGEQNEIVKAECEQCKDYEAKLVRAQENINAENEKLLKSEKSIERLKEQLDKECKLRIDLEVKWQEKREQHKTEVQTLTDSLNASEQKVKSIWDNFESFKRDINQELLKLIDERQQVYEHLETLQKDNDYLCGAYLDNAQFLKDQAINLPQSISELHELVLNLHENLIVSKTGCEFNEAKCISFRDESNLLRDQIVQREKERLANEHSLKTSIHNLEEKMKERHQQYQKLLNEKEELQRIEADYKKQTSELRMQNIEISETNDRLERNNLDLKSKVSLIQQELLTNETVQKDFVRLSQSLQMQLEKIRSADTSVRWQDEDDVDNCPNCKKEFTVTRRKVNEIFINFPSC
jgi:Rab GTPase-binding effector protein 1